jgi:hypothetical protein
MKSLSLINKRGLVYLFFAILTAGLSSCANYTEELWLNKDGSGKYVVTADLSSMIEMMEAFSEMGDQDSTAEASPGFWESMGGGELDSVVAFTDSIPQEVINQLERPELLDKIQMRVIASKSKELFLTKVEMNFTNLKELDEIMKTMAQANELNKNTQEDGGGTLGGDEGLAMLTGRKGGHGFTLSKGKLTRSATDQDKSLLDEFTSDEESMSMLEMMMGESTFTTIVHLPGKVKKLSDSNKIGKVDGKTIRFEYNMLSLIKEELSTDFVVTFK